MHELLHLIDHFLFQITFSESVWQSKHIKKVGAAKDHVGMNNLSVFQLRQFFAYDIFRTAA